MTIAEINLAGSLIEAAISYAKEVVNEEFDAGYERKDDILGNILQRLDDGCLAAAGLLTKVGE